MPFATINCVNLYYEITGGGEPLVPVHGSWGDHRNWDPVVPHCSANPFRWSRTTAADTVRARLAQARAASPRTLTIWRLIEHLDLTPAHVVGNSGGAAIALRMAAKRPDLCRSLVVHEPPLIGLLEARPEFSPMISGFYA